MRKRYRCIRWLLGDQLNENHSWFGQLDADVLYVIAEHKQEASHTLLHVQKLCGFFAAMLGFAERLQSMGHDVLHLDLDSTVKYSSLEDLICNLVEKYKVQELQYQMPDEHRLRSCFRKLHGELEIVVEECDSEHFMLPFKEIDSFFKRGKHVRMETFYRAMRRKNEILMSGNNPVGERWNFDQENRNKLRESDLGNIPEPLLFSTPVDSILKRLNRHEVEYFGTVKDPLPWPVTREQSLELLDFFCRECLPRFGKYQDSLTGKSKNSWSLFHSRLSFSLNTKLIGPAEVIDRALDSYNKSSHIDLAQIEGFVRQILGWREYMRGIYWANMPEFIEFNWLNASKELPAFFWNGDTKLRCLSEAISQSLDHAYAHHIQRLMVTGNFCLLTGINPNQVDRWYLGIYIDALQWVEVPNTKGMALFADGGLIGTKPYAAGGNYINKMSDYCEDCHYNVKEKVGAKACPLNSLYWAFVSQHRKKFENNHRLRMIYGTWDRMTSESQSAILEQAEKYLTEIDSL